MNLARYRKFYVALLGAIATAVSQGLIEGDAAKWAPIVIAFLTAVTVYQVPNKVTPADVQR